MPTPKYLLSLFGRNTIGKPRRASQYASHIKMGCMNAAGRKPHDDRPIWPSYHLRLDLATTRTGMIQAFLGMAVTQQRALATIERPLL